MINIIYAYKVSGIAINIGTMHDLTGEKYNILYNIYKNVF